MLKESETKGSRSFMDLGSQEKGEGKELVVEKYRVLSQNTEMCLHVSPTFPYKEVGAEVPKESLCEVPD